MDFEYCVLLCMNEKAVKNLIKYQKLTGGFEKTRRF